MSPAPAPSSAKDLPTKADEKNHVSPLVATLLLAPLLAALVFGGYQLIQAFKAKDSDETLEVVDNEATPVLATLSNQTSNTSSPTTGQWQTEASLSEKWDRIDDPSGDGWDTEVFNQRVTQQLTVLKKKLLEPTKLSDESLKSLFTSDVAVGLLRPQQPELVWQGDGLQVFRAAAESTPDEPGSLSGGRAKMSEALKGLANTFSNPAEIRAKIKVFRIEQQQDYTETWQTVELFGNTTTGVQEENIVWRARWQLDESGRFPQISQVAFTKYESVARAGGTLFSDCTESIFTNNERFKSQLLVGYNQILQRCQVDDYYITLGNPGLTLGDVNNDGLDDMFVCQENGVPNMLFLQQEDGSLSDFTEQSNANWLQNCRTSLIVDLNNDGNNDLVVAYTGGVVVAAGDGSGSFQIQKYLECDSDILVLNAADYDLDGRLDLYVGVYSADGALLEQQQLAAAGAGGSGFVYVDAKDGGKNCLFHNECEQDRWEFSDVTQEMGLDQDNQRYSQAGAWADFDNDGDPDLYVANDFGPNNLFRNDVDSDGKRFFTDVAKSTAAEDSASGMSVDWADFDRNGLLDLYVGNMYSYAGNRIAFQNQFKPGQSGDIKEKFQRFARGNTLLKNQTTNDIENPLSFEDATLAANVNRGRWAWGSRFADLNNDGWQDLVVANGFITAEDSGDL